MFTSLKKGLISVWNKMQLGLRMCISEASLLPGRRSGDLNSSLQTWENHSFLRPPQQEPFVFNLLEVFLSPTAIQPDFTVLHTSEKTFELVNSTSCHQIHLSWSPSFSIQIHICIYSSLLLYRVITYSIQVYSIIWLHGGKNYNDIKKSTTSRKEKIVKD